MDFVTGNDSKGSSDSKSTVLPTFTGCVCLFITLDRVRAKERMQFQSPSETVSTHPLYKGRNSFIKLPFGLSPGTLRASRKRTEKHHRDLILLKPATWSWMGEATQIPDANSPPRLTEQAGNWAFYPGWPGAAEASAQSSLAPLVGPARRSRKPARGEATVHGDAQACQEPG